MGLYSYLYIHIILQAMLTCLNSLYPVSSVLVKDFLFCSYLLILGSRKQWPIMGSAILSLDFFFLCGLVYHFCNFAVFVHFRCQCGTSTIKLRSLSAKKWYFLHAYFPIWYAYIDISFIFICYKYSEFEHNCFLWFINDNSTNFMILLSAFRMRKMWRQ